MNNIQEESPKEKTNPGKKKKSSTDSLCSLIVTQRSQAHDDTVTPHTVVAAMKIAASLTKSASHTELEILLQALFSD